MQFSTFIDRVRRRAGLKSDKEAAYIAEATLETLGERLGGEARKRFTAPMPDKLKAVATRREVHRQFSLEEFYTVVAARTGISRENAVMCARVVVSALQNELPSEVLEYIENALPEEYSDLFRKEDDTLAGE